MVRLTVVKETSTDKLRQPSKSWFPSLTGSSTAGGTSSTATSEAPVAAPNNEFREIMQQLELYADQQVIETMPEAVASSQDMKDNAETKQDEAGTDLSPSTETKANDKQTIE